MKKIPNEVFTKIYLCQYKAMTMPQYQSVLHFQINFDFLVYTIKQVCKAIMLFLCMGF